MTQTLTQEYVKKMEDFLKSRDVEVKNTTTKKEVKEAANFVAICKSGRNRVFGK